MDFSGLASDVATGQSQGGDQGPLPPSSAADPNAAAASMNPATAGVEEFTPAELYPGGSQEQSFSSDEFVELKNLMADGGDRFGVSAVCFDQQEEMLWMGNQGVSSVKPGSGEWWYIMCIKCGHVY